MINNVENIGAFLARKVFYSDNLITIEKIQFVELKNIGNRSFILDSTTLLWVETVKPLGKWRVIRNVM